MSNKPKGAACSAYKHFLDIPIRWMDNDHYGHVNNVTYYSYFDTLVNQYLVQEGLLDMASSDGPIGLVVETGCKYYRPASFPDVITAGMRVAHIGNSSVRYEIGLFTKGEDAAIAEGFFVHVYVDNDSRKAVNIPERFKVALKKIMS